MAVIKNANSQSLKKYIIVFMVIIGIIFLVLYINKWQEVKEDEKYLNSYLLTTNTINFEMNNIDQIDAVLSETPNYYFVYISYTNDKEIYDFEKKLKPLIDDYNLQNCFYYINITNFKDRNNNYKKEIAKELKIEEKYLNTIPTILYFKDNELASKNITTINEFKELLENNNIKSM